MISNSPDDTKKIAEDFVKTLALQKDSATAAGLHGDLGSGKTTFVQCVAKILGVKENVQSPTFVILKNYKLHVTSSMLQAPYYKFLVHIDCYRLDKKEDIEKLGWQEIISNPKNLVLVEWPERITGVMPKNTININFKFITNTTREIVFARELAK